MKKQLIAATLLASLLFAANGCSALAASGDGDDKTSIADSGATSSSSSSSEPAGRTHPGAEGAVATTAGMIVGFAVGWPVCLVRRFTHDEAQGTRGIAGETNNPVLLGTAGAIWVPLAFATAFLEAPVYAMRNSFMAEKPFSKEQFSLGDMPDYDSSEVLKGENESENKSTN